MPRMIRTSSATVARAIAKELSTEGFLARAEGAPSPVVVVSCMAEESARVAARIRRRDPGSVQLPVATDAQTAVPPPGLAASA